MNAETWVEHYRKSLTFEVMVSSASDDEDD